MSIATVSENVSYYLKGEYIFINNIMNVRGVKYVKDDKYIESYDSEGIYLGRFKLHSDIKELGNCLEPSNKNVKSVMLYDFNFSVVMIPQYSNKSHLDEIFEGFKNGGLNNISLEPIYFNSFIDMEYDYETINPIIPITHGTKHYTIYQKLGLSVKDFDYNKFKKSKDLIIKSNPELEHQANYLFNHSLKILSAYFCCSVDHLQSKSFNMNKSIIKRMELKIHNKLKNKRV
jgi:hypothetical protein